jgi:hypothetical protein
MSNHARHVRNSGRITQAALIIAQLLTLMALGLALMFLRHTTGGTLFLFASVSPVLVLTAILLFCGVAYYKFRKSHELFEEVIYQPGDVVIRQGDPGDSAYFIHEGEVEVWREEDGRSKLIATLGANQYFGEMALISGAERTASVKAKQVTRVAVLGKKNFVTLLSVLPSTKEDVLQTVHSRAMQHMAK